MNGRIALLALLLLSACVPQRQWRTQPAAASANGNAEDRFSMPLNVKQNRLYSLSFVEFDNAGNPYDARQLPEALAAIDAADTRSNHHAVVVVFVHGWKNNAGQNNNNVLDLRRQLNRIAADVCQGITPAQCGLAAIYIGWNGDSVRRQWGTLRQASIYSRRGVAQHVAAGKVGDALLTVMGHVKKGNGRNGNRSIVVGHSFGGLILDAAIDTKLRQAAAQIATQVNGADRNLDALTVPVLQELADLIVLINEAAPGVRAVNFLAEYRRALQRVHFLLPPRRANCPPADTSQDCKSLTRPLILAVSSETDLATKTLLPISEKISASKLKLTQEAIQELPKDLDEKKVSTTASAHTPQLYSHHLVECDKEDCNPCLKRDKYYIPVRIRSLPALAPGNPTNKDMPLNYCLERDFRSWNQTPYWIFSLPTAIVPDHGTIFTDRFTDFLTAFVQPLREMTEAPPPPPSLKQEAGR
ncbi:MAG: hypothetical protein HYX27_16930 [Acidobacteria bacterium]|nr:hypothetical protein [Acidobacteriota bacterium]